MIFFHDFNEKALKQVAREADNQQLVKDVAYMRIPAYHSPESVYVERSEKAFILGQYQKDAFRIIGLATTLDARGQGWAKLLLARAEKAAQERGLHVITTRSASGADFYVKRGFYVTGRRGGDFLLKKDI